MSPRCKRCGQIEHHPFHAPRGIFGGQLETHEFEGAASSGVSAARLDKCSKCDEPEAAHGDFGFRDHQFHGLYEQGRDDDWNEAQQALTESIQQLRGYVQHNSDCELRDTWTKQERCTCGLDDVLKTLEGK